MKISKEDKNPVGIIKHLIKKYPEDIHQLVNLFQSLDDGNGANIENMDDEKTKKLLKSLFKQLGLEKKKTVSGEKVYVKISDEISLFQILKKVAKLPDEQYSVSKRTPITLEEAEKLINQEKPETLLEMHQKKKGIDTTTENTMHFQSNNNKLKQFMEKNNLKDRFQ